MSTHIKHMGWELELETLLVVKGLARLNDEERESILKHLSPRSFQTAVRQMLGEDI